MTLLLSLLLALPSLRAVDVFDSFGPSDAYDTGSLNAGQVSGVGFTSHNSAAARFVAGETVVLDGVALALAKSTGTGTFTVSLRGDQNGLPGAALESWTVSTLPDAGPGNPPVALTSVAHPKLFTGRAYWVMVAPASGAGTFSAQWYFSPSLTGTRATASITGGAPGGTIPWIVSSGSLPAFRVSGTLVAPAYIASKGDELSGLILTNFTTVGTPAIGPHGHVVFRGKFAGSDATALNDTAILVHSGTGFPLIAHREGQTAPGVPGAVWADFGDPCYSPGGRLAFTGKMRGTGISSANDQGLWADIGAGLQLIWREGVEAPGVLPSNFLRLDWFIPGDHGVLLAATVVESGGARVSGLWRYRPASGLRLLVKSGDTISLGVARTVKKVMKPAVAHWRAGSDSADAAVLILFTDGTSSILRF